MTTPNRDEGNKPKPVLISALLFAFFEALGGVCLEVAEKLEGYIGMVVHGISLCCVAAGFFAVWHEMVEGKKAFKIWSAYVAVCIFLFLIAYAVWRPNPPEPKPHFKLSLKIGNPPIAVVQLTNSFLSDAGIMNVIHATNDFLLFNGIPGGCLVIPTASNESNKVFGFVVESDSPMKVTDLMAIAGFPIDWELGFDPDKWQNVGEHLTIPGWRLQVTNLQFLAADFSRPLSPTDIVNFPPITNFSIPASNNPTNKIGMFELSIRANDFESMISSEIFFIRIPSTNVFKPFLTSMKAGTDGLWHADLSSNILEDSQK